jgi:hypothetical protein
MRKTGLYILSTTLAVFLLSACVQLSRVDKDHGKSVEQARRNQTLDPEARRNLEPVTGLNGKAAEANIEKYLKSFEQPHDTRQTSVVQIGNQMGNGDE